MTISGGRTEQLDIFYHVTGFTSDFISLIIVVELVWFFHGALEFLVLFTDCTSDSNADNVLSTGHKMATM